jgi:hypothetical protein
MNATAFFAKFEEGGMARRAIEAVPPGTADFQAMVAERAYFMAEQRGFAPGREIEDWLAAERELAAPARSRPVLTEVAAPDTKKKTVTRKKSAATAKTK